MCSFCYQSLCMNVCTCVFVFTAMSPVCPAGSFPNGAPTSPLCVTVCPAGFFYTNVSGVNACVATCPRGWFGDWRSATCVTSCPQGVGVSLLADISQCVLTCPTGHPSVNISGIQTCLTVHSLWGLANNNASFTIAPNDQALSGGGQPGCTSLTFIARNTTSYATQIMRVVCLCVCV
jgi:hypothetical protein